MARRQLNINSSIDALMFYAGLEISHNLFGDNTSSPQTTELRVGNKEGGGAAEGTLMKWVHIATGKALLLNGLVGVLTGNWFAFLGALVATGDMQLTYWYAKKCGRCLKGCDEYADQAMAAGVTNGTGLPLYERP